MLVNFYDPSCHGSYQIICLAAARKNLAKTFSCHERPQILRKFYGSELTGQKPVARIAADFPYVVLQRSSPGSFLVEQYRVLGVAKIDDVIPEVINERLSQDPAAGIKYLSRNVQHEVRGERFFDKFKGSKPDRLFCFFESGVPGDDHHVKLGLHNF